MASSSIRTVHTSSASSLYTGSMGQSALQLHHGARDLVAETDMTLVVVAWGGGCPMMMTVMIMAGVGGSCGLDRASLRVAASETGHEGGLSGACDSCAVVVMHFGSDGTVRVCVCEVCVGFGV